MWNATGLELRAMILVPLYPIHGILVEYFGSWFLRAVGWSMDIVVPTASLPDAGALA